MEVARTISLPSDCTVLHVVPQEFLLDSQDGIRDPVGMIGGRLEVNVHIVTAASGAVTNLVTAANRAGLVVEETVLEPLAASEAVLNSDERELGVVLVDIGAGSTDVVVFRQGHCSTASPLRSEVIISPMTLQSAFVPPSPMRRRSNAALVWRLTCWPEKTLPLRCPALATGRLG